MMTANPLVVSMKATPNFKKAIFAKPLKKFKRRKKVMNTLFSLPIKQEYRKLAGTEFTRPFEKKNLEESILKYGLINPVVVSGKDGCILDGHLRYQICKEYQIPLKVEELFLSDEQQEKLWIIENNLSMRNLSDAQRIEILSQIGSIQQGVAA